jgi:hypothetical protein
VAVSLNTTILGERESFVKDFFTQIEDKEA